MASLNVIQFFLNCFPSRRLNEPIFKIVQLFLLSIWLIFATATFLRGEKDQDGASISVRIIYLSVLQSLSASNRGKRPFFIGGHHLWDQERESVEIEDLTLERVPWGGDVTHTAGHKLSRGSAAVLEFDLISLQGDEAHERREIDVGERAAVAFRGGALIAWRFEEEVLGLTPRRRSRCWQPIR